jgi:MoxR-like ATPase
MLEKQSESAQHWAHAFYPFDQLKREISKAVVGNEETINFIIIAILANGHVLLEGVPGIAKTTLIKAVAQALGLSFKRIQFTPDLLPADLIGTLIYNPKTQDFETKKGPIFTNIVLADEINRAPAKVQSALLESMQEQQVTLGAQTHKLDKPFLVFATQNPLEQQGTYQLPEAQIDRFMFKVHMGYPGMAHEKEIITRPPIDSVINQMINKEDIFLAQQHVNAVYVDPVIVDYIIRLVSATRNPSQFGLQELQDSIQLGASPRASINMYKAAQARAFLENRQFVTPDDVKKVALPILRHRLILSFQAHGLAQTSDQLTTTILKQLPTP